MELLNDRERARAIAAAGQQLVRDRFNETRMLDEILQVYHEVQAKMPATFEATPIVGRTSGTWH
jgi:hypothetical protein